MKGPFKDSIQYATLLDTVNRYFKEKFPEAEITLTGMMVLLSQTIDHAVKSMAKNYLTALVTDYLVAPALMVLVNRPFKVKVEVKNEI